MFCLPFFSPVCLSFCVCRVDCVAIVMFSFICSVNLSVFLSCSVFLSFCLSLFLSVCPSFFRSVCLSVVLLFSRSFFHPICLSFLLSSYFAALFILCCVCCSFHLVFFCDVLVHSVSLRCCFCIAFCCSFVQPCCLPFFVVFFMYLFLSS